MFSNAGRSIKKITKLICVFGILFSLGIGVALVVVGADMRDGETLIITGIAIGVLGSVLSWISSLVLYAYGDMAENVYAMASIMVKNEMKKMKTGQPQNREEASTTKSSKDSDSE